MSTHTPLPRFTPQELKMLIDIERAMDQGNQPFVVCDGGRWAFPGEILYSLGLSSGETVNSFILLQIQLLNLAHLEELIAKQKQDEIARELEIEEIDTP